MRRRAPRVASALAIALTVINGRAVTATTYPDGPTVLIKAMDHMQHSLHTVHSQGTLSWQSGTSPVRAIVSGDSRWTGSDLDSEGLLEAHFRVKGAVLLGRLAQKVNAEYIVTVSLPSTRTSSYVRSVDTGDRWIAARGDNLVTLFGSVAPQWSALTRTSVTSVQNLGPRASGGEKVWHLRDVRGHTRLDMDVDQRTFGMLRMVQTVSLPSSESRIDFAYSKFNQPVKIALPRIRDTLGRAFGAALRLPDGRVLVSGGGDIVQRLRSALLYDPSSGQWTQTGSMTAARSAFALSLLPGGGALAVGSLYSAAPIAEYYDARSGRWETAGTPKAAFVDPTIVSLHDGRVLVLQSSPVAVAPELYDPRSNTWNSLGRPPNPSMALAAALLPEDRVLVLSSMQQFSGTVTVGQIYDPATGTWMPTAPPDSSLQVVDTLVTLPDRTLLALGSSGQGTLVAQTYDPVSETWGIPHAVSTIRTDWASVVLSDGRVLVSGGEIFSETQGRSYLLNSTLLYDPGRGTWTETGRMQVPRADHTLTLLANGRVLAAGGGPGDAGAAAAELYDPATGIWTSTDGMDPSARNLTFSPRRSKVTRVTGPSPFEGCVAPQLESAFAVSNYPDSEVEPQVAIDPRTIGTEHEHVVATWQQDRWDSGGARGLVVGYSNDSGRTWEESPLPFSNCASPDVSAEAASDPWISIGPDGAVYAVGLTLNVLLPHIQQGIVASTSTDGGRTWQYTHQIVIDSPTLLSDKESVTADPLHAGVAYVVWDRTGHDGTHYAQPMWFSRTLNHGKTWSTPRRIQAVTGQTIGHTIIVDSRTGTLYDFFSRIDESANTFCQPERQDCSLQPARSDIVFTLSTNMGKTWSPARLVAVSSARGLGTMGGGQVRSGIRLPYVAIDPRNGTLYAVWQDAGPSGGRYDQIVISSSRDGGRHWTRPEWVSSPANVPALTPSVAVNRDGVVGITYFTAASRTGNPGELEGNYWFVTALSRALHFGTPRKILGPFDLRTAPYAQGLFLGDYEGLTAAGTDFQTVFAAPNSGNYANRTDVLSVRLSP